MRRDIQELIISPQLKLVLEHCEIICVAECCGVDAFDFSPLLLAHYFLSRNGGKFSNEDLRYVKADIKQLSKIARAYDSTLEIVCFVRCLNQNFSKQSLLELLHELNHNISVVAEIAKQSEKLKYKKRQNDQK